MDYVDDELKQLIVDTNKDSCDGIFTADVDMWSLGLQSFEVVLPVPDRFLIATYYV